MIAESRTSTGLPVIMMSTLLSVAMAILYLGCSGEVDNGSSDDEKRSIAFNDSAMTLYFDISMGQTDYSYDRVLQFLEESIRADSSNRVAHLNMAIVYHGIGRHHEAMRVLESWIRDNHNDMDAKIILGIVMRDVDKNRFRRETQLIINDYDNMLHIFPDSIKLHLDRSFIQVLLGKREEARRSIDSLLAEHPGSDEITMMRNLIEQSSPDDLAGSYLTR